MLMAGLCIQVMLSIYCVHDILCIESLHLIIYISVCLSVDVWMCVCKCGCVDVCVSCVCVCVSIYVHLLQKFCMLIESNVVYRNSI